MTEKVLTQQSGKLMPALARYYISATKKTYGVLPIIKFNKWPIFQVFEDDLRELHVPLSDYAYSTTEMLKKWVYDHKLSHLPIRVFTGDWALNKFLKVWKSESVEIVTTSNDDELLHSELMVAKLYLAESTRGYVRLSTVVDSCRPLLSLAWCEMYDSKDKRRNKFIIKAIDIICEEADITIPITTYIDLIGLV